MKKPILVIMAAGMGSRYGGLKQIEPVGSNGEIIVDFSLYDAKRAGFEKVIFIIKEEIEADVRRLIDGGAGKHLDIEYVFQKIDDLPPGYSVPEGRTKPWGTCHAVLAARKVADAPMCVINADDYYGPEAFKLLYDYLLTAKDSEKADYSMAGYELSKTLTENGHVARGVCRVDADDYLTAVDERLKIMWRGGEVEYTDDDETWTKVPADSTVSMNFWGFTESFMKVLEDGLPAFLDETIKENPMKAEYLLPKKVDEMIKAGKAKVKVLYTADRWHGVTYKEDKDSVVAAMKKLKEEGLYPEKLW